MAVHFARSGFLTIHTRILAYSTQMHAPLNPPSDPTLLAFRIPNKTLQEMNNNNNNIPPSEYLHNTHMRGYAMRRYEIKSEGLLNIHPRLSKKTCRSFLPILDLIAYKKRYVYLLVA